MTQFKNTHELIDTAMIGEKMAVVEHLHDDLDLFTLGPGADINVEKYPHNRLLYVVHGSVEVYERNRDGILNSWKAREGEIFLMREGKAVGARTNEGAVVMRRVVINSDDMHPLLLSGKPVSFERMVPYLARCTGRTDILKNDVVSVYVLALDAHTRSGNISSEENLVVISLLDEQECSIVMDDREEKMQFGVLYELTDNKAFTLHAHDAPLRVLIVERKK